MLKPVSDAAALINGSSILSSSSSPSHSFGSRQFSNNTTSIMNRGTFAGLQLLQALVLGLEGDVATMEESEDEKEVKEGAKEGDMNDASIASQEESKVDTGAVMESKSAEEEEEDTKTAVIVWEFQSDSGWIPYSGSTPLSSAFLEKKFQQRVTCVRTHRGASKYEIDLTKMTEKDLKQGTERAVRRKVDELMHIDEDLGNVIA